LQGGRGKSNDHEPYSGAKQRREQADLTFCEWQFGDHGSNFFANVPTAVVPTKSKYDVHYHDRQLDTPPKPIQPAPSTDAPSVEPLIDLSGGVSFTF